MLKRTLAVAAMTVKKTIKHPRSIMLCVLLLIYTDFALHGVRTFCEAYAVQISLVELVAQLFSNARAQCCFILFYSFLIMDIPGMDHSEQYVIMRSGTGAWMLGKILAIILLSLLWMVVIVFYTLIIVGHVNFAMQWSDSMITLAKTNAYAAYKIHVVFDNKVILNYSLPSAFALSLLLNLMLTTIGGMWVLLINFLSRKPIGNFIFAAAAFVSESIGGLVMTGAIYKFSPVSLALLSVINGGVDNAYPSLQYALVFFSIAFVSVVLLLILAVERRKDYSDFRE